MSSSCTKVQIEKSLMMAEELPSHFHRLSLPCAGIGKVPSGVKLWFSNKYCSTLMGGADPKSQSSHPPVSEKIDFSV